jgi:hypothetical protein
MVSQEKPSSQWFRKQPRIRNVWAAIVQGYLEILCVEKDTATVMAQSTITIVACVSGLYAKF